MPFLRRERILRGALFKAHGKIRHAEKALGLRQGETNTWNSKFGINVSEVRAAVLKELILREMRKAGGKQRDAARNAGVSARTFSRWIAEHNIDPTSLKAGRVTREEIKGLLEAKYGNRHVVGRLLGLSDWRLSSLAEYYGIHVDEIRLRRIREVLTQTKGNIKEAAKITGSSPQSLNGFISRHGIDIVEFQAERFVRALVAAKGNKSEAAKILGVNKRLLAEYSRKFGDPSDKIKGMLAEKALMLTGGNIQRAAKELGLSREAVRLIAKRRRINVAKMRENRKKLPATQGTPVVDKTSEVTVTVVKNGVAHTYQVYTLLKSNAAKLSGLNKQIALLRTAVASAHPDHGGGSAGKLKTAINALKKANKERTEFIEKQKQLGDELGFPLLPRLERNH